MTPLTIRRINLIPAFDLQLFLSLSELTGLEDRQAALLERTWQAWRPALRTYFLEGEEDRGYLLAYLEREVETEAERFWAESPSDGWLLHNLAVTLLSASIGLAVPEVARMRCAPVPLPDERIRTAVRTLGLDLSPSGVLSRKYSALTHMPFAGGCPQCLMREGCPKGRPAS